MIWRAKYRSRGRVPCDAAGFTMLEMLIVMAIIGLMFGIIAARGPMHSHRLTVHDAADKIVNALREARSRALMTNMSAGIVLDLANNSWRVGSGPATLLPTDVLWTVKGADDEMKRSQKNSIVFAPDGSSSGGHIIMMDGRTKINIDVDWLTGRVSVVEPQH